MREHYMGESWLIFNMVYVHSKNDKPINHGGENYHILSNASNTENIFHMLMTKVDFHTCSPRSVFRHRTWCGWAWLLNKFYCNYFRNLMNQTKICKLNDHGCNACQSIPFVYYESELSNTFTNECVQTSHTMCLSLTP